MVVLISPGFSLSHTHTHTHTHTLCFSLNVPLFPLSSKPQRLVPLLQEIKFNQCVCVCVCVCERWYTTENTLTVHEETTARACSLHSIFIIIIIIIIVTRVCFCAGGQKWAKLFWFIFKKYIPWSERDKTNTHTHTHTHTRKTNQFYNVKWVKKLLN